MQTEYTRGFKMEFDEDDYINYIYIKDSIERLCNNAEKFSILYNKNPLIQSVQISNNTFITCAVYDNEALFGLFKPNKSEEIIDYITGPTVSNITEKAILLLDKRIENTAKNKKDLTYSLLRKAWDKTIAKQKSKQNEGPTLD